MAPVKRTNVDHEDRENIVHYILVLFNSYPAELEQIIQADPSIVSTLERKLGAES